MSACLSIRLCLSLSLSVSTLHIFMFCMFVLVCFSTWVVNKYMYMLSDCVLLLADNEGWTFADWDLGWITRENCLWVSAQHHIHTGWSKNDSCKIVVITASDIDRSFLSPAHLSRKFAIKVVFTVPATPESLHYTTLGNTNASFLNMNIFF